MATTRIIPMHINKGKTIAQCMKARIDYVKNPDKTEDGEFISSYACAPESADQEFVLARNQYLNVLRSERNKLHAAIREKKNRMKEIIELRQAIRDYRRTKDVYAQYKASGWSPKFYNEHRKDIESHKKAQAVYSSVDGKMPTLKELSAEYDALKAQKENDDTALEELKPQLTTMNHIKYNFDVLERDYLPEEKDLRREGHQER